MVAAVGPASTRRGRVVTPVAATASRRVIIGSAARRMVGATAGWTVNRLSAHGATVGTAAKAAVHRPPRKRLGVERHGQCPGEAGRRQQPHGLVPFGFAGVGAAAGLISTRVAPSGGWKVKSASVGWIEKSQSDSSATKLGWLGSDR